MLDYLIDLQLAAKKAQAEKLDADSRFRQRKLAYYHDKLAMEELLASVAKAATTDDAEHKAYDEAAKAQPPEEEIHARHILLPTEDEAKAALARVKDGEDFAKVANELSKDTGGDGGDLGWFTKDRMVPEFADAAFKLKPGEISDPVKTQFGWHIIQVEDDAHQDLPALRSGQGSGGALRRPEGAERRDRRAARRGEDRVLRRRRQADRCRTRRRRRAPRPRLRLRTRRLRALPTSRRTERRCDPERGRLARSRFLNLDDGTLPWPRPPRSRRSPRKNTPTLPAIEGVRFATIAAGVRYAGRTDVMMALFDAPAQVAGVFTKLKCPSAPVDWCRDKLKGGHARARRRQLRQRQRLHRPSAA